ncbi:MAG: LPS biosynthesis glycosyltransferase [Cyanobacteria bacterium J06649_4]
MAKQNQGTNNQDTLVSCLAQTFVIAYKEPTEQLTQVLTAAGCDCTVLRQVHQPGYETYSPSFLCLLNHRSAWELALRSDKPTLIVEADFVPVKNFAQLPPPFDPAEDDLGIAWLYTCASQIYNVPTLNLGEKPSGQTAYAQGYSTAMVAYVVTAKSARSLIDLAAQIEKEPGPRAYSPWDSGIEYFLRDVGFRNYVPFRNYGEHGGLPNPEHKKNKLSKAHRADVLHGKLAFAPMYATARGQASRWVWFKTRLYARVKGIGRLVLLKYLRQETFKKSAQKMRLLRFALLRHLTL